MMETTSGLMNASDVQQWNKLNFPQYGEDTKEKLREWVLRAAALQFPLPVHAALLLLHALQRRGGGGGQGAETLQQPAGAQPRPPAAGRHGQARARGRGRAAGDR